MEYAFLYDNVRHLLAIGYNVGEHRRDPSYYDLLASEGAAMQFRPQLRRGILPQDSWFALGRLLTAARRRGPILLSWSGSNVRVPDAAAG